MPKDTIMQPDSTPSILLKGGTALVHDSNDIPIPTKTDILIRGSIIEKIEPLIQPLSPSTDVIDCTDQIISPGFVDTHRHLWQTANKGNHGDHTLLDYFAPGNFVSSLYKPEEVYWGQLAGALESISAGTTTVVDHAHIIYSPEHSDAALKATVDSGLRSIYAYCATPRVKSWTPFSLDQDMLPEWFMSTFERLSAAPLAPNDRVTLGFAFDMLLHMPPEKAKALLQKLYDAGVRVFTAHAMGNGPRYGIPGSRTYFELLDSAGLLALPSGPEGPQDDPMYLIGSHANYVSPGTLTTDLLKKHAPRLNISTTPMSELTMSLGPPRALVAGLQDFSSLGIDCHTASSSSIPGQMRLIVAHERSTRDAKLEAEGKWASTIGSGLGVKEAFNLGTIGGARAVGMARDIGRLKVGAKADITIISTTTPNMLGIGAGSELAGVVMQSEHNDVEHVIVDGIVRKRDGKLMIEAVWNGKRIEWSDVVKGVQRVRQRLAQEASKIDLEAARGSIQSMFRMRAEAGVGSNYTPSEGTK